MENHSLEFLWIDPSCTSTYFITQEKDTRSQQSSSMMRFDPHKVLSRQELQQLVYSSLGFSTKQRDSLLPVGFLDSTSLHSAMESLIRTWVKKMDSYKQLVEQSNFFDATTKSQQLKMIQQQRGCTFLEYCRLFDGVIPEEEYPQHPAFLFFGIHSEGLRRQFITNKEATWESYIATLQSKQWTLWKVVQSSLPAHISSTDLHKHCYISGKSGSGKTELIKWLVYHLHEQKETDNNYSLIVIDPQGDLAEDIRNFHFNKDSKRLIYIDPYYKKGFTPSFNPFHIEASDEASIAKATEELVKVMEEIIQDAELSNQMRSVITPCIATLIRKGDASLLDLQRFMDDEANSDLIDIGQQSPVYSHRLFFQTRFTHPSYKRTKMSIYTRLQSLLNSETFTQLLCSKSTFNLSQAMDQGKLVVFNLSKGRMGIESSEVFGRFIIARIQQIAQRRAAQQNKEKRRQCFVFIDEFQNYITDSIQVTLQEARKYAVSLILANQTIEDMSNSSLMQNILNNTEVKIVGRNGFDTLAKLAKEISIPHEDLLSMKRFQFFAKSGDVSAFKFTSSDVLTQSKFQLSVSEQHSVQQRQLAKYYRKKQAFTTTHYHDDSTKHAKQRQQPVSTSVSEYSPQPKFGLQGCYH